MNKIQTQTLKGFRDFLPAEERKRQYVVNKLKKVFESFGFEPLETPALEYESVLLGKYGQEGDKLMYRFTDNGERKVALRYDQTVPLARVVAQYGLASSPQVISMPFKRYQIQPVWRAENTQKGRFREFLQCDIDTVGSNSPLSDAEIISCTIKSLESLGFKDFKVLINDRRIFKDVPIQAIRILDKLKKIGRDEVIKELEKIGLSPDLLSKFESLQPSENLKTIFSVLEKLGITKEKIEFLPTLARGLDYYTGMIFEVEIKDYNAGSVAGGGRYDNLIGLFANTNIPAVGVAFGFDRVIEAMDQLNLFPANLNTTKVLVTVFSPDLFDKSAEVILRLRSENINAELWLDTNSKLDKQLKYADFKKIPYVIIIGPDEAENNKITLKDFKNKTQETLSPEQVITKLTNEF